MASARKSSSRVETALIDVAFAAPVSSAETTRRAPFLRSPNAGNATWMQTAWLGWVARGKGTGAVDVRCCWISDRNARMRAANAVRALFVRTVSAGRRAGSAVFATRMRNARMDWFASLRPGGDCAPRL